MLHGKLQVYQRATLQTLLAPHQAEDGPAVNQWLTFMSKSRLSLLVRNQALDRAQLRATRRRSTV